MAECAYCGRSVTAREGGLSQDLAPETDGNDRNAVRLCEEHFRADELQWEADEQPDPDWSYDDIAGSAGFGDDPKLAAYRCRSCGTVTPYSFTHDSAEEDLPEVMTGICGTRWDGCGSTEALVLESDGYLDPDEGGDGSDG